MVFATEDGLARILAGIPNEKNRCSLQVYLEEQRSNGTKLSSLMTQANHVRHRALFLGPKTFLEATKEDVRRFTSLRTTERSWRPSGSDRITVRRVPIGNTTMNIRKIMLRSFQRWVRGGTKRDPFPPDVSWLEQRRSASDEALPVEQILTPDELRLMIEAAAETQTKALLAVLYDPGARASEFCSLRIRDVIFDDHGAILALPKTATNLKTGARRIRIITSTRFLKAWINAHPSARDPSSHPPNSKTSTAAASSSS
jgi:integrase